MHTIIFIKIYACKQTCYERPTVQAMVSQIDWNFWHFLCISTKRKSDSAPNERSKEYEVQHISRNAHLSQIVPAHNLFLATQVLQKSIPYQSRGYHPLQSTHFLLLSPWSHISHNNQGAPAKVSSGSNTSSESSVSSVSGLCGGPTNICDGICLYIFLHVKPTLTSFPLSINWF